MSDMTIDNATRDTSVGGGELVPVSDAGSPKSMSVSQIKDYVLAQIAVLTAADGVSVNNDSVYILKGGALKPVSAATLAAAIFNEAFGRAAVVGPNGNEVIAIKDSDTRKTITFTALKTWLQSNMTVTPDLTLSTAGAAGTLGDSDLALVVQAGGGKKVALGTLKDYVLNKLAAFLTAQTAAQSVTSSDVVLIVQGGNVRKATVAQLVGSSGDVKGPATTTENKIPQWDSTQKKLKDGLAVTQTVDGSSTGSQVPTAAAVQAAINSAISGKGDVKGPSTTTEDKIPQWDSTAKTLKDGLSVVDSIGEAGSNGNVPTEKAVRDAINDAAGVGAPEETPTNDNIPQWGNGKVLTNGKSVQTSVRNAATASHDALPTEKAVRTLADGLIKATGSHSTGAIPVWGAANELLGGKSVVTVLASGGSDDNIPTEKAVRDALPGMATTAAAGLMSAADKTKVDNLVDTTAVEEIGDGSPLDDTDVVTVLKGGSTWKKALITRFWTWLMGKLPTFKLDAFAAPEDNTNLNASTSAHGLCPKFPNDTSKFLRGDGAFAEPAGTTDFTGDGGSGGTHGLVPAPASGDAAANKFLNANGQWAVPPSAAGVDIPGATAVDAAADADALYCFDASENGYRKVTLAQVAALVMGTKRYDNIFIPAGAMVPSASNGALPGALTFTNVKRDTVAFSNTTEQGAEFSVVMPEDWDGGAVRAKLMWTAFDSTKAEQGEVVAWKIGAVSTPDEGAITVAPTNYVTVTDNLSQVNELHRTGATGQIAAEGTRGAGNLVHFVVKRDPSAETANPMDTEALLLGVWLQYGRTSSVTEEWS